MRHICVFSLTALIAVGVSCLVSEPEESDNIVFALQQKITITASYVDPETRTQRDTDGAVLWSPGDEISLFYGSGINGGSKFTAQNTEVAKVVNFTGTIGVITGGNDVTLENTYFWATYPYCAEASCDGASITTVLPSAQVATADTFADDLFPSIGRSSGLTMGFYNICGGLKFTVSEEGIKSVTLQGHNNEVLAGKITVGLDADGKPEVTSIEDGSETIVLSAPAGESFEVGKSYYLVFVPTVFENGFTLTFTKESLRAIYDRAKKTTIRRSAFGSMTSPDKGLEWEVAGVPIPDKKFRAYMLNNFDTNGNGALEFEEAEAVKEIKVNTDTIHSLSGIEYCKNLEFLKCNGSRSFDSSIRNYVNNGLLESIDISNNPLLLRLECRYNQLTTIDLSENRMLRILDCCYNQIASLDISNNSNIIWFKCGSNQLTNLDVSNITLLKTFDCSTNQLTNLDVHQNTFLEYLSCGYNKLTNIDVSNLVDLTDFLCDNNLLTSIDISNNKVLNSLYCANNQLSELILTNNNLLVSLSCRGNNLSDIDLSNNTMLKSLFCSNNALSELDITNNPLLDILACDNNNLSSLCIDKNTLLTRLDCQNNQLTILNVEKNTNLEHVNCSYNQLTSLDVSSVSSLYILSCVGNRLTSIDVSNNDLLQTLECSNNRLNNLVLYIRDNTAFSSLMCYDNQLTTLDLSHCIGLISLECSQNQLMALDVSNNLSLIDLCSAPMDDEFGNNILEVIFVSQEQEIPYVTVNRQYGNSIPEETLVKVK